MAERHATARDLPDNAGQAGTFEYDSATRSPPFVDELAQLWHYRDLVLLMAGSILKNRYKRSLPVSYTHLDVYKRQGLSNDTRQIGLGLISISLDAWRK